MSFILTLIVPSQFVEGNSVYITILNYVSRNYGLCVYVIRDEYSVQGYLNRAKGDFNAHYIMFKMTFVNSFSVML